MARKRKLKKGPSVDPEYLRKQREALKRVHRKVIVFNDKEMEAIEEYCRQFKVSSKAALIREATMEHVLAALDENHPTLF